MTVTCSWTILQMKDNIIEQLRATFRKANSFFSYWGVAEEVWYSAFVFIVCLRAVDNNWESVSDLLSFHKVKKPRHFTFKVSPSSLFSATAAISCLCLSPSSHRIVLNCVLVCDHFLHLETRCQSKTAITGASRLTLRRAGGAPITDWLYCLFNWHPGERDTLTFGKPRTKNVN